METHKPLPATGSQGGQEENRLQTGNWGSTLSGGGGRTEYQRKEDIKHESTREDAKCEIVM